LYQDNLKLFLEKEMDKIDWFEVLSLPTKQEILWMMEREERSSG